MAIESPLLPSPIPTYMIIHGSRRITIPFFFFTAFANFLFYFLNYNINSKMGERGWGERYGRRRIGEERGGGWLVTRLVVERRDSPKFSKCSYLIVKLGTKLLLDGAAAAEDLNWV